MKKFAHGLYVLLILAIVLFSTSGCKGKEAPPAAEPEVQQSPLAQPAAESAVKGGSGDERMATVNGKVITRAEVDLATDGIMKKYESQIPPGQREMLRDQVRTQALENLINQQLLLAAADAERVNPDEKEVEERYQALKGRFPTPEDFQNLLTSMNMNEEEFRKEVAMNLRIEDMLEKKFSALLKVDDQAVSDFYRDHPEDFQVPERVTASHILIATAQDDTPESKAEKRSQAAALKQQIDSGSDFAELAAQHSSCPSKAKGGDLGAFERGKMVKPFEDAAFSLKKGEISDVVETPFGYHLIKVTDREPARVIPLAEVQNEVRAYLDRKQKEQALNQYLEELRGPAKIEYAGASENAAVPPPAPAEAVPAP